MHRPGHLGQVVPLEIAPQQTVTAGTGQWLLLASALISGPALIYGAMKMDPPEWLRAGMMIAGVATVGYNLSGFFAAQQRATQAAVQEEIET